MKVLIISHNPISTYHNMGKTLLTLFHSFKKEELCQFYIYPTFPDVDKCESSFRITDKDVVRNLFARSFGTEITDKDIDATHDYYSEVISNKNLYQTSKNKRPYRNLLRDFMWKMSHWYNKKLAAWLKKEKPTVIFIAPGMSKFIYNVAIKISKKHNIPIVAYICDDYYHLEPDKQFGRKYQLYILRKKIKQLFNKSSLIITISDSQNGLYSTEFNRPCLTIMTGSSVSVNNQIKERDTVEAITYMGNISCNRFKSLCDIGIILNEINKEQGTKYSLKVYTSEQNQDILNELKLNGTIEVNPFVTGEKYKEVFYSAEMLLHVEAFDDESINRVKYSVSTKIADSLGSGICLFAYGPSSVASMQHLIDNDCAICATSRDELKAKLLLAFNNKEERERVARNGLVAAHNFHDSELNSKILYDNLKRVSESVVGESFTGK